MTEGEIGWLVIGGLLRPFSSRIQREKFHVLKTVLPTWPTLSDGGRVANLCNFRDNLLTWRAILSLVQQAKDMPRLSHTEPSQNAYTHCLVAACLSFKPKPNGSILARCHARDTCLTETVPYLWNDVIHCPSYIFFSLSMQSEQGYTNQHLPAVVLIIAPQHRRRSAMHSQRCTRCTSFAWVHRDDF